MRVVSGKHLCRGLERRGWVLIRVRGSHYVYAIDQSSVIISVPVHGNQDLKRGLLQHLMKLAELTEEDL